MCISYTSVFDMHIQKNYLSFEHLVKQSSTQFVIADDWLHRHVLIPLTSDLDLKRTVRTISINKKAFH